MADRKIKVLHFINDDKFIDGTLKIFDEDGRFENDCVMIVGTSDYQFKYVKSSDRVKLLRKWKMVKDFLNASNYDVAFFYSLTDYHVLKYIQDDKIVIWWAWGFDIYGPERFIDIPLYKPLTEKYLDKSNSSLVSRMKIWLKRIPFVLDIRDGNRKKAIKRIDYFQPPIHTEYELMKKIEGFRAKEFYYPKAHSFRNILETEFPNHGKNIILGHSATYTNNHLDVWNEVNRFIPNDTTVVIPINYGITEYAEELSNSIYSNSCKINFLKEFLPREKYFEIVDTCSYAIFGVLREAAMGNIYRCLANGVKLFLYRDSVPYKYLMDIGFVVFAIEDINESSFITPLTREQAKQNRVCLAKERDMVDEIRESAIAEIQEIVIKRNSVN